jgi:hypothetical protein
MGRHDSAVARVTAVATALCCVIGATGAVPAIAAVPSTLAAPDLLEPAKSALRLKQFADAAVKSVRARWTSSPTRSPLIHARNTCWAPCTWPVSVSARMSSVRGRSSRPLQPGASHARRMHWQHLQRTTRPPTNQRHELGLRRPRHPGTPMRRGCCRQASCHCKWIPVPLQPNPR